MKSKYELVLFDLDGTLTNSGRGITNSLKTAFNEMGKPVPGMETLRRFIGPPMWDSFTSICHMPPEEAAAAIKYFRKVYNVKGIFENEVYEGIPELLANLLSAGALLAVATSKPVKQAHTVLDHYNLNKYFKYVSAEDDSECGGGKERLIGRALKEYGLPGEKAVMIGDTKFDAAGARKAGTRFIGALYGFGSKEEMVLEGAEKFVKSPAELENILIDNI